MNEIFEGQFYAVCWLADFKLSNFTSFNLSLQTIRLTTWLSKPMIMHHDGSS
jgi:hypothetical protein